jgi:hypothetical protein
MIARADPMTSHDEKLPDDVLQSLRDLRAMYVDNVMKTAGFALLAIGWLITSESARAYLDQESALRYVSVGAAVLFTALQLGGLHDLKKSADHIGSTASAESPIVRAYLISDVRLVGSALMTAGLFALLVVIVLSI